MKSDQLRNQIQTSRFVSSGTASPVQPFHFTAGRDASSNPTLTPLDTKEHQENTLGLEASGEAVGALVPRKLPLTFQV